MNILITGGCGFLGSNLARHGASAGHRVTVFDNMCRVGACDNRAWLQSLGGVNFLEGDIRDFAAVTHATKTATPDMVFHLAGQVAMTTSLSNPRSDFETNALGTLNVLEALREHAPRAGLIYSSTNKVYGDLACYTYEETATRYRCLEHPNGFDETTPLEFHSPYGCSKGSADQYILDYHRMFGIRGTVFRHSSMYGGRQFATFDQGWIGWFCRMAVETRLGLRKEPFTIAGNGKQVRDVLHADDLVALYFAAAGKTDHVAGEAFNIGGGFGNSLSLLELFTCLGDLIGRPLDFISTPARQSDQLVFIADLKKITQATGWRPRVDFRTGLQGMLDWSENLLQDSPTRDS
jgi:CDP-paratose 2-epimerase